MCLRHIGDMLAVEREPGQRSGSGQWCWFEPSRPRRYADVVQRQNVGFPSRTRGFNSRYPLQPQTGAYLQFYNAGAPSDPGTWQDGVAVAQRPHKPYGGGSNPSPATIWRRENLTQKGGRGFLLACRIGMHCRPCRGDPPVSSRAYAGRKRRIPRRRYMRAATGPRRVQLPGLSTRSCG